MQRVYPTYPDTRTRDPDMADGPLFERPPISQSGNSGVYIVKYLSIRFGGDSALLTQSEDAPRT